MPDISVLVPNFNGAGVIEECLASVLAQDTAAGVEVLVHDDYSNDGSADIVKDKFPQVTLIRSPENVGFCVSCNRLAEHARGKYLLLLNNDARLEQGSIEAMYRRARATLGREILSLPQFDMETGRPIDYGCYLDPFFNPVPIESPAAGPVPYVMGALLWIPADTWRHLGGFPEWIESIGEDIFLCQAARRIGVLTRVLDGPPYHHHVGKSFGGGKPRAGRLASTYRRRYLSERNRLLVTLSVAPGPYAALILPIGVLTLLLEGVLLTFLKLDLRPIARIYLPAIRDFFYLLRPAVKSRALVTAASHSIPNPGSQPSFLSQISWRPRKLCLWWRFGIPRFGDQ